MVSPQNITIPLMNDESEASAFTLVVICKPACILEHGDLQELYPLLGPQEYKIHVEIYILIVFLPKKGGHSAPL